jgi:hypothetical protein
MRKKEWIMGLLALTVIAIAVWYPKAGVPIHNLADAQQRLKAAGYHCIPDCANGRLSSGFAISRENMSWFQAGMLCKVGNMGPEWKGKVWVTVSTPAWRLCRIPDDADARVWGPIVAFGDQEILSEIDRVLQS